MIPMIKSAIAPARTVVQSIVGFFFFEGREMVYDKTPKLIYDNKVRVL